MNKSEFKVNHWYWLRNETEWRKVLSLEVLHETYPMVVCNMDGHSSNYTLEGGYNISSETHLDLTLEEYIEPQKPVDLNEPDEWLYIGVNDKGLTTQQCLKKEFEGVADYYKHKIYRVPVFEVKK